jgi:hypothetical protein
MTIVFQGRAPGLYDEQLQRQHQEKALFRGPSGPREGSLLGRRNPPAEPAAEEGEK